MILKSVTEIIKNSKEVKINKNAITTFCNNINSKNISHWAEHLPIDLSDLNKEQKIAFLFVFNSISFSYWGKPKWHIIPNKKKINRGTFSLLISLKKAVNNNCKILTPLFLSKIKQNDLNKILKGNVEIPLLKERTKILNELGKVTLTKYDGKFGNILRNNSNDALKLLNEIVDNFATFKDQTKYKNKPILFYKRAQLLVSDLNHILNKKLKNINKLTACADYILPMVLKHYKILQYSRKLEKIINTETVLKSNGKEELEIRANTLFAVELIKEELAKRNIRLTSMQINDYLWILGDKIPESEKYHLIRTIWY